MPSAPSRTRATALPPSERRAEIIAATLPLLLAHGASVTTRQIAEAAGIAEGTIFRVFPDKESLVEAAVDRAVDSTASDAALDAIDRSLPLEARLVAAVEILRRRVADLWQLRTALGMMHVSSGGPSMTERHAPDLTPLAALFVADRDQVRGEPLEAAHLLRGLTIAGTHPALILNEPLSSAEIVSLFLDGIRNREEATR
ncbi:MAG TPA: TetR/AcrR family transcriptional regulator [Acidimicrobiia bacterium]|jgi:AcrR family transcriptional regulator